VSGLVLDCSVAVSWCFEDEAAPETDAILERVRDEGAIVPALWHLELGNVLIEAERRGRLAAADTTTRLELIRALPVATDDDSPDRALRDVLTLSRAQGCAFRSIATTCSDRSRPAIPGDRDQCGAGGGGAVGR
jgi:hypothetical protein